MDKLQRKSAKLFAENATATAGGLAQFGSLATGTPNYSTDPDVIQALPAYANGWSSAVLGTKSPALEDRNALDYLLSYQQAYIMQRGIPEWLDTETYYIGSVVAQNSSIYISLADNNTNNDVTDTNYWRKFYTPTEIDALLSTKANTNLSNVTKPYVTDTYVNGTSWYRVWSDGWCEQGGLSNGIPGPVGLQISFLVPMANTNYSIYGGVIPAASTAGDARLFCINRTKTSMEIDWTKSDYLDPTWWEVKGYKAS